MTRALAIVLLTACASAQEQSCGNADEIAVCAEALYEAQHATDDRPVYASSITGEQRIANQLDGKIVLVPYMCPPKWAEASLTRAMTQIDAEHTYWRVVCHRQPVGDDTWDPVHGERPGSSYQPPGEIKVRVQCSLGDRAVVNRLAVVVCVHDSGDHQ